MTHAIDRRGLLSGGVALAMAGCSRASETGPPPHGDPPALKSLAAFPVGCCVTTQHLADPAFVALFLRHFSQLTPEWEMKMEAILAPDGTLSFVAADRLAAFARANGVRLFGTTLIWGEQKPAWFQRLDENPRAFAKAYEAYITAVVGRYRGHAVGWDVINEPLLPLGGGLRQTLWSRNLGAEDHILAAFQIAAAADPDAILVLNDYNLENVPTKRADFLRLAERLLRRGAPIGALGSQSHLEPATSDAAIAAALPELASLGLPVHVSELDLSIGRKRGLLADRAALRAGQARQAATLASAFRALPAARQFAFTVWGLRDKDSWLRAPANGDGTDEPLLFDDAGRPKADFWAVARAFAA